MGRKQEKTVGELKGETTSIHVQQGSADKLEDMGRGDEGPSPAYNKAVDDAHKFHQLKKEKKTELKEKVREIREEARNWEIDLHEIGL